jgi:hypothetical protein
VAHRNRTIQCTLHLIGVAYNRVQDQKLQIELSYFLRMNFWTQGVHIRVVVQNMRKTKVALMRHHILGDFCWSRLKEILLSERVYDMVQVQKTLIQNLTFGLKIGTQDHKLDPQTIMSIFLK